MIGEVQPKPGNARNLRLLLMSLLLTLTFEGIARKACPFYMSIPIFFFKDLIILGMARYVFFWPPDRRIQFLWYAYKALIVLFYPVIVITLWHDPVLAVYGTKQYLYYPIVGFAIYYAFQNQTMAQVVNFFKWFAALLIPTLAMSLLDIHLPQTHWVNLSVEGAELGQFSGAGILRVSSTFSFVAQYGSFLQVEIFILALIWGNLNYLSRTWKLIALSLAPLYILSCYITGSRSPVYSALSVCGIAFVLSALKLPARNLLQMAALLLLFYAGIVLLQHLYPTAFEAYLDREHGHLLSVSDENKSRILEPFLNWMSSSGISLFGYGIGTMSNGADSLSEYARVQRYAVGWTESDFSTTLFEGGIYLVLVWYGFRGFIIYKTISLYINQLQGPFVVPMALCLGYLTISGTLGTLALQPPVAIWWWLSIGVALTLWSKCLDANSPVKKPDDHQPPPSIAPSGQIRRGRSAYANALHKP